MSDDDVCEFDNKGYLPPQCFNITIEEFKEKFVNIKHKPKREKLFNKFIDYQKRFDRILIKIWVDGSYTTSKKKPNDMDLGVHYDALSLENMTIIPLAEKKLFTDQSELKKLYNCHIQLIPIYPKDHFKYAFTTENLDYWEKWFMNVKNRTYKKGFIELSYGGEE